ncbi:hypothetical protein TrispH2_011974 [Trichoplax sp. H2]|nr:hypothetical protein TrispH2_011974 [Trichoplax sp. H2]|eukprot:RDD35790.1 hypothetical protein TrispH2_011974 [Trichoplax sp. H2]
MDMRCYEMLYRCRLKYSCKFGLKLMVALYEIDLGEIAAKIA